MLTTKAGRIAGAGIAAEAGLAGVQDLKLQEVERLSQKYGEDTPEGKDLGRAAFVGAFGLGAGALGYRLAGGLGGTKLAKKATDSYAKKLELAKGFQNREKRLLAAEEAAGRSDLATIEPGSDLANGFIDLQQGKAVLEEIAADADPNIARQYNAELMNRVGGVLTDLIRDMAQTGELGNIVNADTKAFEVMTRVLSENLSKAAKTGQKAGDAIEQTKKMLDEIDDGSADLLDFLPEGMTNEQLINSLEQAISKQGLTILNNSVMPLVHRQVKLQRFFVPLVK